MSWDFFRREERTARKAYRCEEAGCAIPAGARYVYSAGRVEGDFASYRLCLVCDLIAEEYVQAFDDGEGWPLGGLRTSLRDDHGIEEAYVWAIAQRAQRRRAMLAPEPVPEQTASAPQILPSIDQGAGLTCTTAGVASLVWAIHDHMWNAVVIGFCLSAMWCGCRMLGRRV